MIQFVVPGKPIGKGRPRFAKRGNFVSTYTDEKTASHENLIKLYAGKAMNGLPAIQEAAQAEIVVMVIPPHSWSKTKRQNALNGLIRPTTKPDCDNVAKLVLDAMNGIVYADDKQIARLMVEKHYAETARTEVRVWPL